MRSKEEVEQLITQKRYTYVFSGLVHPTGVNFTLHGPIMFMVDHPEFGVTGISVMEFAESAFTVRFHSDSDYRSLIETVRGYLQENVAMVTDAFCFVNSYNYDVEMTSVICEELEFEKVFEVRGELNINKTPDQVNREFTDLIWAFSVPVAGMPLRDAIADFRRGIKYPKMTGSFCFRAIETIRRAYFEGPLELSEKDAWIKLRDTFEITREEFFEVEKFSTTNRHGSYPVIMYEERERIMNFTRTIIEKTLVMILKDIQR